MLEVQQGQHQTAGQTRTADVRDAATGNHRDRTKQVKILDLLARFNLASSALGQGCFDFLPGKAAAQHRQRVAQIDHQIQEFAEKSSAMSML
jgi:hypothetical protein